MWYFILAVVSLLLYYVLSRPPKDFWSQYGVRQVNHVTFMQRLMFFIGKASLGTTDEIAYKMLGKSEEYCGFIEMGQPVILLKSMELIKKVLIKDCLDYFVNRKNFIPPNEKMMSKMVSVLEGEEWKGVRNSLTPTFTTGKIRRMMECFNEVGNEWATHLQSQCKSSSDGSIRVNVFKATTPFTVDVTAAAVFGMNSGSIRDPNSYFSEMCLRLGLLTTKLKIKFALALTIPKLLAWTRLRLIDVEATEFVQKILIQGMEARMNGSEKKNDMLQLIAEARKGELEAVNTDELDDYEKDALIRDGGDGALKKNYLKDEMIATAQLVGFFFAGFVNTSNIIAFAQYALAAHQDVQEKLRRELEPLFKNGWQIDYDELNGLPYMEMFLCELFRKYSPSHRLERVCTKDYYDPESGVRIPKGAVVVISTFAIHNDPQYYDHPEKFRPEHFSPEEKARRTPYAYMPFGSGPRNCIGMRFALIQLKAAIAHIVHKFHIEPTPKTPIPMQVDPNGFGVSAPTNLELKLTPRIK